ncbi:MAG: ParB/RepB/Spo0J family partition protein [Bacteroidales bacterium]|jgi:ParB family chromosome partitioning protein|nr:ParB/RepB/Spo0J family partition protein [Bacteroidales bacterium]
MSKKTNVLGGGLSAILSDAPKIVQPVQQRPPIKTGIDLEISKIKANPNQPRTRFDENALQELANSIQQLGVIQPITVRQVAPDEYQIISGERRFRASQLAGVETIPAYIRDADDNITLTMALVENVQREDLDAIEIATSYQRLIDECELTQEELSKQVGKTRSSITNFLRLLKLPPEIQFGIINKDISMGHARALVSVDDCDKQMQMFAKIIEQDLSVRQVEDLLRDYNAEKKPKTPAMQISEASKSIQHNLEQKLGAKVTLCVTAKGSGKLTIPFTDESDFARIAALLNTN